MTKTDDVAPQSAGITPNAAVGSAQAPVPDGGGGPLAVLAFGTAFVVASAILLAGAISGSQALRTIGAFGSLFLGVGAAPFQLNRRLSTTSRFGLTALVGLSWMLVVGGVMADVRGLWAPTVAAAVSGLIAVALHIAGVSAAVRQRGHGATARLRDALRVPAIPPRDLSLSAACATLGTALWLGAALTTHEPTPGNGGFLAVISPTWFLGVALVVAAVVIGRARPLWGVVPTLLTGIALTLTPALVYGGPQGITSFKQILITQYVLSHHHIEPNAGIYQAYSWLFAGVAWVSQATGLGNLFGVATFWPVMFSVLRVIAVSWLARRISPSPSRRWLTVLLVLLTDAFGQDYYSPQSVGYILAFLSVALLMRGDDEIALSRRWIICLALLAGVAGAPTHELSPFIAVGALVVLAAFRQAPPWSPLTILLPAIAWVVYVYRVVGGVLSFGQLFDLQNFSPPHTATTVGLSRSPVIAFQSHFWLASLLVLSLVAVTGFLTNVRLRRAWAYIMCPAVGLAATAANPYGNEGIFRASIFGIPWLAASATLVDWRRASRWCQSHAHVLTGLLTALSLAFLLSFMIGDYELDGVRSLQVPDWDASRAFQRSAPRHAFIMVMGTGENPVEAPRFTVRYASTDWVDWAAYGYRIPARPTRRSLVRLQSQLRYQASRLNTSGPHAIYVWWARTQVDYDAEYGVYPRSGFARWLSLLKDSPDWSLAYRFGHTYIFRLTDPGTVADG